MIEINDEFTEAYINRGYAKKNLMDYQGALADYNKACEIEPNNKLAKNDRGSLYVLMKDYQSAINDFTDAILLDSEFAAPYFNRALAYLMVNKTNEACADLQKAIQFNIDNATTIKEMYCE